jgi:hypothetical protein
VRKLGFTTNRSRSDIEPRENASLRSLFSVVGLEIVSSSLATSLVGLMTRERFPLRNLACSWDAFLTRRFPLPRVQPLEI